MRLDLDRLRELHPLLSLASANDYAHKAAVGLDRHGHAPGVQMRTRHQEAVLAPSPEVHWSPSMPGASALLDVNRVTEDTAEAIALALVHHARGWVVRRRLQRGDFADWLLMDPAHNLVALEVSGVSHPDGGARMRTKIIQVQKCSIRPTRAACVVTLASPESSLVEVPAE